LTHPLAPETHPEELASFAVDGALERLELLRDIATDRDPVNLHLRDGSAKVLVSTLLPVGTEDEQTGAALGFELTVAAPPDLLQRLPLAATGVTIHRDVKVQFDLLLRADARSPELLRAELPQALWHFQRRQAFRIEPPPAAPVRLSIRYPTVKDTSRSVKVIDISVNGVAFLWPRWTTTCPNPVSDSVRFAWIWPARCRWRAHSRSVWWPRSKRQAQATTTCATRWAADSSTCRLRQAGPFRSM